MWYWYISGVISTLLIISALLNFGLVTGWVQWIKPESKVKIKPKSNLYDWADDSGPISKPKELTR
jgi:hypothetical protein